MDDYGLITLLRASYRDYVEEQELKRIKEEFFLLQQAETEVRREKAQIQIQQMAKLKIELKKFSFTYQRLVKKAGVTIPRIETYMNDIKNQIKRLSFEKNHK